MRAAILAFSGRGYALGARLMPYFKDRGDAAELARCPEGGLSAWTRAHFGCDALIFIGSCGIAVRAVAPFLAGKTRDPAVVVVDERARHAVSLLSGHAGGANDLTAGLARFLGAAGVVTTATDVNGVFAIDAWAATHGLKIANPEAVKRVSARLLAGGSAALCCAFPVSGRLPAGLRLCRGGGDVCVTHRIGARGTALRLVPPVVTLGVGCRKGASAEAVERAFAAALKKARCHPLAVVRVCSIDLKAREPGILAFCRAHALPFRTFSARELMALPGTYAASAFVTRVAGADNVCERSAVLGGGPGTRLLSGKRAQDGVTTALAVSPFTVCFDEEGTP